MYGCREKGTMVREKGRERESEGDENPVNHSKKVQNFFEENIFLQDKITR